MPDVLEKGLAWLGKMNSEYRSTPVIYQRDGQELPLTATIGRTVFQTARDGGPFETSEARDFLVDAKTLILGGQPFLPRPGDRIAEEQDGKRFVHEVMALDDEPCFRWCDPYQITLRIHTKHILTEVL
jgi:hypothetical protein